MLPFMLPGWLIPWWDTFREDRRLIRDSLRAKVVRKDGDVVGIFPFMLTERPGAGPIRARDLAFLGADTNVTEQRAPLFDPACGAEVAKALSDDLRADRAWDWIMWVGLDRESEFARVLDGELQMRWGRSDCAHIVQLKPTWDEFRAGLKRNIKESLRHGYNSLKRDGFTPRLLVAQKPDEVEKALEVFFRLHTARAQMADGPAHPDRFAPSRARRFLTDVCRELAEQGYTRVFTLDIDGEHVASRIGFMMPGCLYLYYSGFEPGWGKYGVMTTTLAEALRYAIEQGTPMAHLSMGSDVSKSRWGAATPVLHEAVCVQPRLASLAALRLYSWGRDNQDLKQIVGRYLPKRPVH